MKIPNPLNWLKKLISKIRNRWIIAKAYPAMKKAHEDQLKKQVLLKKDILKWLRAYFGVDADSKYIPKDFKNKQEVKAAVLDRFGNDLEKLNLKYKDLFA